MAYRFQEHQILCLGILDELESYSNITVYHGPIYERPRGVAGWPYRIREELGLDKAQYFGGWKNLVQTNDTIIMGDCARGTDTFRFIHRVNPTARIIYYYLNSVLDHGYDYPPKFKQMPVELYTFDKKNADEFCIGYKPFYYAQMKEETPRGGDAYYDVFFVGADKGRLRYLLNLENELRGMGLSTQFIIKQDPHHRYTKKERAVTTNTFHAYSEVCEDVCHSRAILDIVQDGQTGMTLRPYEALHFEKKLITNNRYIKEEAYYDKQNIFLLGEDNLEYLPAFLRSPYKPVPQSIKNMYTPEAWLEGFFEE